ncbi:hypothetical protein JB92DRAFT_3125502 [Gautieria morchelliformis]|nr:hypothetical protein JB92DRAFT_3125502 [Gautieria morchelliformis]
MAIAAKKKRTDKKKKAPTDAAEPADHLEDDPPMDWAEEGSQDALEEVTWAFREGRQRDSDVGGQPHIGQWSHSPDHPPPDNISDDDVMHVKHFPSPAGVPYGEQKTSFELLREEQRRGTLGTFGPFEDLAEWELAEWLIKSGASQSEIDKFLKLDITRTRTGPSYMDKRGLLKRLTPYHLLPPGNTEELFVWCRNPVDCVKELIGNPAFKEAMHYAPEKVFTDSSEADQVFNEMWTGEWWWDLQEKLPKGATIAPIILASDKTQLSQFSGDKQAWPVYLTIGNIDKAIRRQPSKQAMVLLGYLQVTKLECLSPESRKERAYCYFVISLPCQNGKDQEESAH